MNIVSSASRLLFALIFVGASFPALDLVSAVPQFSVPVIINSDQTITYQPTPKGDRICDFSTVGYNNGNSPLPDEPNGYQVPVLVTLSPGMGDQTDRIQAAIDYLSTKPLVNGFRGCLLLKAGAWDIYSSNKITVKASGVVIKGEGDNPLTGTRIYAKGTTSENGSGNTLNSRLITFSGNSNSVNTAAKTLVDAVYIPSGVNVIPVTAHSFSVGQRISIRWPGSVAWQKASLYQAGATADVDPAFTMNRVVTAITPNSITLDAPITTPLDPAYGRGYIVPITSFGNITNVGISNCYFESIFANDTDENHLWNAVLFQNAEDGFMHDCTARYFAYSVCYVDRTTRRITVNRSQYLDGISQLGGGRRYSFVLTGEMALVSNTITRYGRHSYVLNWEGGCPGPNVFVDGTSIDSYNESGAHSHWNNAGLWDNISILKQSTAASLQVKLERPSANCVAWNCTLVKMTFENMPLSPNWSLGCTTPAGGVVPWVDSNTGQFTYAAPYVGKAETWSNGTKMSVRSLYENQVQTRLKSLNKTFRYAANPPTRISFLPVIRTPAQLFALSGTFWSYRIPASNLVAATKAPGFAVTGLPTGITANATTGLISGTLPTVAADTNYNLGISVSNVDGKTTKAMTLTVKPSVPTKIPLTMSLEVDINSTIPLILSGNSTTNVPMVTGTRLLSPMVVSKAYGSNNYTATDVPVPVRGNLSVEGLTSPVSVTYNGSSTLPTVAGYYDVVATLNDPVYAASATGTLLITNGTSASVTLNIPASPTASNPVVATSSQPSLTPVITYDGSPNFPATPGLYSVKAVVANSTYSGSNSTLVSIGRTSASLAWGNLNLNFTGAALKPTVTTNPPGLPTQVSIIGDGIFPGSYQVTASITDPSVNYTPLAGTMLISMDADGSGLRNWLFGVLDSPSLWTFARRTGAQLRSFLPDANLYPDTTDYPTFTIRVRRDRQGALVIPQASDNLAFGPASAQKALLVETTVLDATFEQHTYAVVPVAGGPASSRAFLRLLLDSSGLPK